MIKDVLVACHQSLQRFFEWSTYLTLKIHLLVRENVFWDSLSFGVKKREFILRTSTYNSTVKAIMYFKFGFKKVVLKQEINFHFRKHFGRSIVLFV